MEHHDILHLTVERGLTAIFLIGGLGVEDQQKGLCLRVMSLYGSVGNLMLKNELEQQILNNFVAPFLDFSRKNVCLPDCGCVSNMLGSMLKYDSNGGVLA